MKGQEIGISIPFETLIVPLLKANELKRLTLCYDTIGISVGQCCTCFYLLLSEGSFQIATH